MLVKPTTDVIAKIKVVGVGGGGGNAVNTMISQYDIEGVEFIAVNTDAQVLKNSEAPIQLQIGQELTRGLGAGGSPDIGGNAAEESIDTIHEHLAGADMVFLTAGMGGGTGTGATPVISSIAKNLGALTVGVVTKPFEFEGKRRMDVALDGIEELKDKVDTLIVIPNQRLLEIIDKNISFLEAMRRVDDVLAQGVKSISSLVTQSGFINVDFADVKSVMSDAGSALMGMGSASGEDRAVVAAQEATSSPLLETSITGATGVLFTVTGGKDLSMHEVDQAAQLIQDAVDPSANIIFGAAIEESLESDIKITVLATGFDANAQVIPTVRRPIQTEDPSVSAQGQSGTAQANQGSQQEKTENGNGKSTKRIPEEPDSDDDTLEVPAFMRRSS
jgi:cell division protein FtsZ